MNKLLKEINRLTILCYFLTCFFVSLARSDTNSSFKASLNLNNEKQIFKAYSLPRGGTLKISSRPEFEKISSIVNQTIIQTHNDLEGMLGPIDKVKVEVKLLPESVFFLATQAPNWTNALYYNQTIVIPIKEKITPNQELIRSIRHEFTHAVLHRLTAGNAPGWFDEGLAQFIEGKLHPALLSSLDNWLTKNQPVPFYMLQNGFTKLEPKYVVPAYAQSLWATRFLVGQYGLHKIRYYLDELARNNKKSFLTAFGLSESEFEQQLNCTLTNPICLKIPENCVICKNFKR